MKKVFKVFILIAIIVCTALFIYDKKINKENENVIEESKSRRSTK